MQAMCILNNPNWQQQQYKEYKWVALQIILEQ